ncbi:unnamed protein product, partial [Brenthis ino]
MELYDANSLTLRLARCSAKQALRRPFAYRKKTSLKMLGRNAKLFFGVSVVVLIVAVLLASWGFPKIVQNQIHKNIQLTNTSKMFDKWREMPIPLTFKIYVFNVTNTDEVNEGGKPIVKEVGPYVYKEYRVKKILEYGPNDTIKYMLKKTFYFDQEESGSLKQDDHITVINYSYLAAILSVQDMMPSATPLINKALVKFFSNLTDPFLRVKAKDLFFDGIFLNCSGDDAGLKLVCGKIKMDKTPAMRPAEDGSGFYFSMFSHLNTTETGPYDVNMGVQDINKLGNIVAYKGERIMKQWGDDYCGQINGTDGSIFPPFEGNPPKRLYTFEPETCRSVFATLKEKREIYNMSTYYYEIDNMLFSSKSANPDNKCFCKKNWSANHDGCLVMGVLNLSPCKGAPAIVSLPHFYLASEELLEYIEEGIKPDPEKHSSFVYLETKTGVVIKGVQRLQFNIELRNIKGVPQLENVETGLFPFLWVEEGAEINKELREELQSAHNLLAIVEIVRWAILGVALVLCFASALYLRNKLGAWTKSHNSVSFILRPGTSMTVNKG